MNRSLAPLIVSLTLLCLFGRTPGLAAAEPAQWNQFRGPAGTGRADDAQLPLHFSEKQNVVWKVPLWGKAWSSPVIEGHRIWLTTATEDGHKMSVLCVDFASGKTLHEITLFENEEPDFCHPMNSYATPTPVVSEGKLYVHFGSYGTACLDTASRQVLWQRRDLECNHFRGPASSPILHDGKLIMHFDGYDLQYVVALNADTGETIWRHDRAFDFGTDNGDNKKAYCTPTVIVHQGQEQLICPAAVATEALDPDTGRLLWTVKHGGMNASARPIYAHGMVYLTNGMGSMVVVRPEGSGDITGEIVWDARKGVPRKSSLLMLGELLFMVSDEGVASCYDPLTGEVHWSKRLPGREYAASPIFADGRIYLFSREGDMPVLAATKEFELLAENRLDDGCMASPAIKGDAMIVRTVSHLYRIEEMAKLGTGN
jgi:outer membrane protein assembly factor BamB